MRNVLVIGGNLFIGRELVTRLLDRGDEVTILHRSHNNPFEGRTREIRCDRNDVEALREAVAGQGFEIVFDNVYDWQRGTTGIQVRQAATSIGPSLRRYVFVSSCAAYGEGLDRHENSPLAGPDYPDAYCRNKADSERALLGLRSSHGLEATTLRPPFVYGPFNPFYREAFFWDRLLLGRPILIPEDGSRLMHLVEVGDFARALLAASERPEAAGRAYNVAHTRPIRQDDLVGALAATAGVEPDLCHVSRETLQKLGGQVFQEPFYFGQYYDLPPITLDISRARRELGFQPSSLAEGLDRAWRWYRTLNRPEQDWSFEDRVLGLIGQ